MIEHLKIGEREYPLSFGIKTYCRLARNWGVKLGEAFERIDGRMSERTHDAYAVLLEMSIDIAAIAMSEGARREGQLERYTADSVTDLLDSDPSAVARLQEMIIISMGADIAGFTSGQTSPTTNQRPTEESKS